MHRPVCFQILVLVALVWDSISGDWVEIPFLQPSTTTQKSTIIRKNINHPSFMADSNFMSQVLLSPSAAADDDRDSESEEDDDEEEEATSLVVNHATLSPVRISNLVDYEGFVRSSTSTEGPISTAANKYSHFEKRIYEYPRMNVSSKLGWPSAKDELQFVTANRHRLSPMEPDRQQPMSNKYQEESIEYRPELAPQIRPPQAQNIHDRIEIPIDTLSTEEEEEEEEEENDDDESRSEDKYSSAPAPETTEKLSAEKDQFHDFDDYDEEHPFMNVTATKRRRRPGTPGRVTIVKVIPPRRRFRPVHSENEGGFSGFVSFLKKMQDKFMQRTAKNIGDKIKVLQDLKDQLLLSIEKRMSTLWRDPNIAEEGDKIPLRQSVHRVKRHGGGGWMEYGDGGHGGMDFPSAEAALLTISFLTFAVFLIKLVLQVINTIKAKHYTYNTLTGMSGVNPATLKIVNRNKRDAAAAQDELWPESLNILSAINDYKFT